MQKIVMLGFDVVEQPPEQVCGCGEPVRYMVATSPDVWACNKYARCRTREELQMHVDELRSQLRDAKKYCNDLLTLQTSQPTVTAGTMTPARRESYWRELWRFINTLPE